MAGRGRGRGRGSTLSFSLDALGLQKSDVVSAPVTQPAPLYPPMLNMPVPNTNYTPDDLKLIEIGLRAKAKWRKRAALLPLEEKKKDIERYSDKYQVLSQPKGLPFKPDWSQFPEELRPDADDEVRPRKRKGLKVGPNLKGAHKSRETDTKSVLAKAKERLGSELNIEAAKGEEEEKTAEKDSEEEEGEEKEKGSGEEEEEEAEAEDTDGEDETDYNISYFDNGEGYGDEDAEDDEPSYNF